MSKGFGRFFREMFSYSREISNLEGARFSDGINMGDHGKCRVQHGTNVPHILDGFTSSSPTEIVNSGRAFKACSEPNRINSAFSSFS